MDFLKRAKLYIQIGVNYYKIRNVVTGQEIENTSPAPFSSKRLIVANFTNLQEEIIKPIKSVSGIRKFMKPDVAIHQLNTEQDELSEVEQRVLKELVWFARKTIIYVGPDLSDSEVLGRF